MFNFEIKAFPWILTRPNIDVTLDFKVTWDPNAI